MNKEGRPRCSTVYTMKQKLFKQRCVATRTPLQIHYGIVAIKSNVTLNDNKLCIYIRK